MIAPIWAIAMTCVELSRCKFDWDTFAADGNASGHTVLVIGGPLFLMLVIVPVISWFLHYLIYFLIGIATPDGGYVPGDFIALLLFFLSQAALAYIFGYALHASANPVITVPARPSDPPDNPAEVQPRTSRTRVVLYSVVKAGVVAILTGIASQIGGWVGGFVILVISAAFAAYFGTPAQGNQSEPANE